MNELNTERLGRDFPELYALYGGDGNTSFTRFGFARFGFEFGDGWYRLVRTLSREIVELCRAQDAPIPVASQVKAKFGVLRFYVEGACPEGFLACLRRAGERSARTCERCGEPGERSGRTGVWRTLCADCREAGT